MQKEENDRKTEKKSFFTWVPHVEYRTWSTSSLRRHSSLVLVRRYFSWIFQFLFHFPWNYRSSNQHTLRRTHNAAFIKFCLHFPVMQWMMFCFSHSFDDGVEIQFRLSFTFSPFTRNGNECALFGMIVSAATESRTSKTMDAKQKQKYSMSFAGIEKQINYYYYRTVWDIAAKRMVTLVLWGRENNNQPWIVLSAVPRHRNNVRANSNFHLKVDFRRILNIYWLKKKLISSSLVTNVSMALRT